MKFHFKSFALKLLTALTVIFLEQVTALAQTGPAGIGNASSNKVWLDASFLTGLINGSRISTWTDRSGNSWNAVQSTAARRPTYMVNQLNGQPVVRFDRTNGLQFLDITSTGIGTVMSNSSTLYAVTKANSGGVNDNTDQWQSIFGAIDSYAGILFQGFPTTNRLYFDNWVGNPRVEDLVVAPTINQGQWYIATRMPRKLSNGTTLTAYVNGIAAGSVSSDLQMKNYNNLVRMGASYTSGNYQYLLNGDIAEIILFNFNLNDAQRIIVDNYLSAKYNQLIDNDYYSSNDSNYIKDVQGIGTTDGSAYKHIASGNGKGLLIAELNNSLNATNEFLLSGHAMATNALVSTDLPLGEQSHWQRVWYLEKTGSLDAKLSFDFSQAGLVPEGSISNNLSSYKLLYRSSSSGMFTIVKTGNDVLAPVLENGDQLVFQLTNAQLISGYYTIGYSPTLTWTGTLNNQWDLPGNWNLNRIPTASDHVYVNACTTCPIVSNSTAIAGLRLNSGSALNLQTNTVTVGGISYLDGTQITSNGGALKVADFAELKNSEFKGSVTLEKTGGSINSCYGGNTFSAELKVLNSSDSNLEVATQATNVIQ